jgi:hypothetical protein
MVSMGTRLHHLLSSRASVIFWVSGVASVLLDADHLYLPWGRVTHLPSVIIFSILIVLDALYHRFLRRMVLGI